MSLLGAPLDRELLEALRAKYPGFGGALPDEAKFWTPAAVEQYLSSDGKTRPPEVAAQKGAQTCPLLTRLRVRLASERIGEATADYRSFCRHLQERRDPARLPTVAECADVPKAQSAPADVRHPVVLEKRRDWPARLWQMDFWRRECGSRSWTCRAKCPAAGDEAQGMDALAVEATVEEYVEYARLLHRVDRKCAEENSLAYPRVSFDGWLPFCSEMKALFAGAWRQLGPPKLKDHTHRWVRLLSSAFGSDELESIARYYFVSLRATGTIDRLHAEPHGAHLWLNQVEGRRVFFLFPPQEAGNLYAGYTTGESPVDVFNPSAKRHPKFAEAKAQVATLYLGQTLLIPSGWWWYSVALEPSVTLGHHFWNMENKVYFVESLKSNFDFLLSANRALREGVASRLDAVHQQVMADDDSDADDD